MKQLIVAAVIFFCALADFSNAEESAVANVRVSKDGAGPSHMFWLTGPSANSPDQDMVGIIDPLLSAIRIYAVERITSSAKTFPDRFHGVGACALPISFRPWRVLQFADEIQIEGMPSPGKDGQNTTLKNFTSQLYSMKRDLLRNETIAAVKEAGKLIDTASWDPAKSIQCGLATDPGGRVARSVPFLSKRGVNNPNRTIILKNSARALTDQRPLTVRARTGGLYYLYSVRELEPAGSTRVVQITEGAPTTDGITRLNQRLLLFGSDGSKPISEIGFDDTHFRSKIGQKPIAILPTGEVVAMGRELTGPTPDKNFQVRSCGIVGNDIPSANNLCTSGSDVVKSRQDVDSSPVRTGTQASPDIRSASIGTSKLGNANDIFRRVSKYADLIWSVDTSGMPNNCRTIAGCEVEHQPVPFVPLKGIRLTRGTYNQRGVAYAQTETLGDVDRFLDSGVRDQFSNKLKNVKKVQDGLPGNLADDFLGDVGIDCSTLLQLAWNGRPAESSPRIDTSIIQNGSMSYRCPDRLPNSSFLRSGDAIAIHVKPGADHVVLYAANIAFDGASENWLVLESTSSCDGVCWSVYDPSFFNGWGLYRASNRNDKKCSLPNDATSISKSPFPSELPKWREKVVEGLH